MHEITWSWQHLMHWVGRTAACPWHGQLTSTVITEPQPHQIWGCAIGNCLCFPTGMCLWGWGSMIAARSAHALLIVSWEVLCARRGDVKLRERDISSTVVTAFAWMSMQQKYCNGFINYGCPKGKTGKTSLCPRGSVCYAKMDWLLHLTWAMRPAFSLIIIDHVAYNGRRHFASRSVFLGYSTAICYYL